VVFTCAAMWVARYVSVWGVCGSLCGVDGGVDGGGREQAPASGDADPSLARLRDFVARRRAELGLSQRKLAELAGVSLGTATRLERGAGPPRVSTVPKLEDALQWPRGTFQAIRDGEDPPKIAPRWPSPRPDQAAAASNVVSATALRGASQHAQALSIAAAVVAIGAVCLEVLTSELDDPAARVQALRDLDANMRQMESLIAASLPDAESFDDAMAVLREVHQSRESIQKAAEALS